MNLLIFRILRADNQVWTITFWLRWMPGSAWTVSCRVSVFRPINGWKMLPDWKISSWAFIERWCYAGPIPDSWCLHGLTLKWCRRIVIRFVSCNSLPLNLTRDMLEMSSSSSSSPSSSSPSSVHSLFYRKTQIWKETGRGGQAEKSRQILLFSFPKFPCDILYI